MSEAKARSRLSEVNKKTKTFMSKIEEVMSRIEAEKSRMQSYKKGIMESAKRIRKLKEYLEDLVDEIKIISSNVARINGGRRLNRARKLERRLNTNNNRNY
jgi:chromosome segregation ATPase